MKVKTVNGEQRWTVEDCDDLLGWAIIHIEDFTPNVKRLHVTSVALPNECHVLYCSTNLLATHNAMLPEFIIEDILDAEVIG